MFQQIKQGATQNKFNFIHICVLAKKMRDIKVNLLKLCCKNKFLQHILYFLMSFIYYL